ncbi:YbjN domain-containing protein [Hyphococcus flavus]|uniref:YbjN domain-containing protein n=1 Tax=Hyphococcus flavus TaxID=1866326 RepID=A0AAE9ZLR8_9PROT|nr:YbjN domain-containing protein [Hyphococcus flavus]WDI33075.1 YbjN domain-containing protein [Hyphococcus flavus]
MRMAGLLVGLILFWATPLQAQNAHSSGGMTIQEVARILEKEGLPVSDMSGSGADWLRSEIDGTEFDVETYNCNAKSRCTEFLFIAGFDMPNGFPIELINKWNAEELAGRAFLDERRDPFLDHVVSVSAPNDDAVFLEGFYLWAAALREFVEFIEYPQVEV